MIDLLIKWRPFRRFLHGQRLKAKRRYYSAPTQAEVYQAHQRRLKLTVILQS